MQWVVSLAHELIPDPATRMVFVLVAFPTLACVLFYTLSLFGGSHHGRHTKKETN